MKDISSRPARQPRHDDPHPSRARVRCRIRLTDETGISVRSPYWLPGENDPELRHHPEGVHQDSRRDDFLPGETRSGRSPCPDVDRAVRRANAHELPSCVPDQTNRVSTLSPSVICSSTAHVESGNADRMRIKVSLSRPVHAPVREGHLLNHVDIEALAGWLRCLLRREHGQEFTDAILVSVPQALLSRRLAAAHRVP